MANKKNNRLESLDILRGITVAGMILVNNGYGESFEMLRHSKWNGMTPCDLVFPFFLFIMGISCYLSLSKSGFTPTKAVVWKVMKRGILLFLIGLAGNWADTAAGQGTLLCFGQVRIWAVLQRIALCYLFVSLFALFLNHRYILHAIIVLLAVYAGVLVWGNGYSECADENILAQVDLRLFGYDHIYHKSPVDPEGLLGTVSSVAHVLIGFYCGLLIKQTADLKQKIIALFVVGTVCVIAGYLLSYGLPLNKRVWSPSYVLVTCGLASLLLALLIRIESASVFRAGTEPAPTSHLSVPSPKGEPEGARKPEGARGASLFFKVFGMNALAIYVASEFLAIFFGNYGVSDAIYSVLHAAITAPKWASLAYALTFVAINFLLGYVLYRKKIFIKL